MHSCALLWKSFPLKKQRITLLRENNQLDYLETEQYSELYTAFQEEMQTIVQLQEESTDLKLGLNEVGKYLQNKKRSLKQIQDILTQHGRDHYQNF